MSIDFNLSWEHEQIKEAMRGCLEPCQGRREELTKMVIHAKIYPQEGWDALTVTVLMGCTGRGAVRRSGAGAGVMCLWLRCRRAARASGRRLLACLPALPRRART